MTTWWGQHDPSDNSQSQLNPKPYSRNPQSPAKFLAHEKFSSAPYYHALKMGKKELEASGALASFPHHAPVRKQIPQEFRGEKVVLRAGGAGWHWRHPSGGRRGRCRGRDGQGTRPRPRREAQLPRRLPAMVAGPSPGDGGEANAWGDRSGGGGHGWRRGFWERALGIAKRGDHTRVNARMSCSCRPHLLADMRAPRQVRGYRSERKILPLSRLQGAGRHDTVFQTIFDH
jgi:hypothetical protein